MKKIIAILCLCCMLISCQGKSNIISSSVAGEGNATNGKQTVLHCCKSYDENGFFEPMINASNIANIYYIDAAAKKQIFLCARLECEHKDDTCTSFIPTDANTGEPIAVVSGSKLYLVQRGATETQSGYIISMDKNGLNKEQIYSPKANETIDGNIYSDGESLYFMLKTTDKDLVKDTFAIIKLNLSSKEANVIYDFSEFAFPPTIVGAVNENLIIDLLENDAKNSGEYVTELFYFDVVNSKMADAPQYTFASASEGHEVYDNEILVMSEAQPTIALRNLSDGTEAEHDYSALYDIAKVSTDLAPYIFKISPTLYRFEFSPAQTNGEWIEYIFDAQLKSFIPFTLENKYRQSTISILAEFDDTYLTISDYIPKMIDVGEGVIETFYPQYAFITKENYSKSVDSYELVELAID